MDNRTFDITAEGQATLEQALKIGFGEHRTAAGWRVDTHEGTTRLVLSAHETASDGWAPFLTPIDAARAVSLVTDWLADTEYGEEPDHDGSNGRGWRVYCGDWGHVEPYHHRAFVAIEPCWAMYGK
jgi:hypothetical protein